MLKLCYFCPIFIQNRNMSARFGKIPNRVSRKSVQWQPRCSIPTVGGTNRHGDTERRSSQLLTKSPYKISPRETCCDLIWYIYGVVNIVMKYEVSCKVGNI
jgi:hypothetical protein